MDEEAALDAFQVWCEGEGEELALSPEEAQSVWLAAWWACREAMTERGEDYGTEERHDHFRPFTHQHHHAHYDQAQGDVATKHEGEFSHPHRHGRDGDHHRPW